MDEPDKYDLRPVIKITVNHDKSCWQHVLLMRHEKMELSLCGFPHQDTQSQSNHEKSSRQVPTDGQSTKYLTSSPQNCQDHQKQGKSEKLSQPRDA